jgi:hypothetical protein
MSPDTEWEGVLVRRVFQISTQAFFMRIQYTRGASDRHTVATDPLFETQ